jgi:signal peptidase II
MRRNAWLLSVFLSVLCGSAGCDHASKQIAVSVLAGTRSVSLAHDTVRLELSSNPGAFLSLGAGLPERVREVLFLAVAPLLALWLCAHLLRARRASTGLAVALGLVLGGGLANWLDRLLHDGAVTDFISVGLGPLRTGVFNIADVAVVGGAALLVALTRRRGAPPRRQAA